MPAITATPIPDGYRIVRHGVAVGSVFRVGAGWVTVGISNRFWRRTKPRPNVPPDRRPHDHDIHRSAY